ncbi:MAG: hypothetical protein NVSMB32_05760 [Actinomycetota bacterium]
MARSLSAHLQALKPEDLETLLQRRPEARRLLNGRATPDYSSLADALSRSERIRTAAASLSAFLTQLLQLALWLGPEVSAGALAEQAPGVPLEDLRAGAEDLGRWGLAFVVDRGRPAADRAWLLGGPGSTAAAITRPAGLGPLARRVLVERSPGFLSAVAHHIGLASRPHSGKEALVIEIAAALSDPERVKHLLAEAPAKSFTLFGLILSSGGMTRHELMTAGHVRWSDPPWGERRKVMTPMDWLESRGLLVFDGLTHYAGLIAVPAEVELALRGGRIFELWPSASPPQLALPPEAVAGHLGAGDPSKILAEMESVLEEWSQSRPTALQRGGLGVRELRKTAKTVGFPERYVCFLYALAAEAELIGVDSDGRVVPSPEATVWAEQPAPQRWSRLFDAWRACRLWNEQDGLVAHDKAAELLGVSRVRTAVLQELSDLPRASATNAQLLGSRIFWHQPELFHCEDCAQGLVGWVIEALLWLGTAAGPNPIRLLEPGRSAALDPAWYLPGQGGADSPPSPGVAPFATEVATCTVGADLNIIVPGPPVHELGWALSRFADLKASSPARIYLLSETSLRRALDDGMQASQISAVLERYASRGVPQNVAYLIEDTGRRHGHLVAGAAGLYLRSEDPGLLRAATADRRLAAFRPRLIAPTVAILQGDNVEKLLVTLRAAGYLPVAEDGGGILTGRGPSTQVQPLLSRSRVPCPLTRAEAVRLAHEIRVSSVRTPRAARERAASGPGAGTGTGTGTGRTILDGRSVANRREIARLVELAIQEAHVLEIAYVSTTGRHTTRCIEPMELSGGMVGAWCRLRQDERNFVLANIESARATGERFDEGESADEEIDTIDFR